MTIDELIIKLQEVREELGGDAVAFVEGDLDAYEVSGVTTKTYGKRTRELEVFGKTVPIIEYIHCDGTCDGKWCREHIQGVEVSPW